MVLTIRCASCKRKLFRYQKLGKGGVHRCHFARIDRLLDVIGEGQVLTCPCGAVIGHRKTTWWSMVKGAFTTSGQTVTRL